MLVDHLGEGTGEDRGENSIEQVIVKTSNNLLSLEWAVFIRTIEAVDLYRRYMQCAVLLGSGTTEFSKLSLDCNFHETCRGEDVLPLHFPSPISYPRETLPIVACLETFHSTLLSR